MPKTTTARKGNNATSKKSGDDKRSIHSEKGKSVASSHGAQAQKGKEDLGKGKTTKRSDSDSDEAE